MIYIPQGMIDEISEISEIELEPISEGGFSERETEQKIDGAVVNVGAELGIEAMELLSTLMLQGIRVYHAVGLYEEI